jgi:cell wall-associated NlpC family hydrolase
MTRAAIVDEALSWQGTPFHHRAMVKGAGVDCAHLLKAVYATAGIALDLDMPEYAQDWNLHHDEPRFLAIVAQYADPVPAGEVPQPGDVAMFRYGRHAAHGAIVTAWPVVVHAWRDAGKVVTTEADNGPLAARFAGAWHVRGVD